MKKLFWIALAIGMPFAANAATVAQGVTLAGDAGGIDAAGSDVSIAVGHPAYTMAAMSLPTEWVWIGNAETVNSASFEFTFDLAGYAASSAILSGEWAVDNLGEIFLNGNLVDGMMTESLRNFQELHSYGTSEASYFNAGVNTLTFNLYDAGGPAAFRATAIVTADVQSGPAPVPLPAGAVLMLGGLGLLGAARARRARG
ncbi:putative secreted protein [Aliiruegeria haliotis]|uniref:Putative secreted protein n=1 Tax=Aliiruegeria haliotis TaxID=1280846 RepID=A0A2T0RXY3_9RHOB|nr:hypothetical protein [Aliiruegeria haliotis]PRY26010.1 putative secreted protein [Aliiruegeria haliotis]